MNPPNNLPARKTSDLRKGRVSLPGARYFITCCAMRPTNQLTRDSCARDLLTTWRAMEQGGDMMLLCASIMPDHVHLLMRSTDRLKIGQVVGKFKTQTRNALAERHAAWQANYFERHLRPNDEAGAFARYVFMNPYRAELIGRRQVWPFWVLGQGQDFDFLHMLEDGAYPPATWFEEDWDAMGLQASSVGPD